MKAVIIEGVLWSYSNVMECTNDIHILTIHLQKGNKMEIKTKREESVQMLGNC